MANAPWIMRRLIVDGFDLAVAGKTSPEFDCRGIETLAFQQKREDGVWDALAHIDLYCTLDGQAWYRFHTALTDEDKVFGGIDVTGYRAVRAQVTDAHASRARLTFIGVGPGLSGGAMEHDRVQMKPATT